MAGSPRTPRHLPAFHAPPPSPVAGHHNISPLILRDDEFSGFLKRSRRVPELILPHRLFRRETAPWSPPEIDLQSLMSPEKGGSEEKTIRSAARSLGCFQVVNHGIEVGMVLAALEAADAVFRLHPEWKKGAARSPERRWGFEVEDGEGLGEGDEFFWLSGKAEEMAGVLDHQQFSTFSGKMEHLLAKMKRIALKIELALMKKLDDVETHRRRREGNEMAACVQKHRRSKGGFVETGVAADLNHDMLGTLIRSIGSSHALGLHLFAGASSFRVFSKRAPVLFRPSDAAILVTVGDQMQASSGGEYRHVIGKPEYRFGETRREPISITFHHSYTRTPRASAFSGKAGPYREEEEKIISISEQLAMAGFLLLFYYVIACAGFAKA